MVKVKACYNYAGNHMPPEEEREHEGDSFIRALLSFFACCRPLFSDAFPTVEYEDGNVVFRNGDHGHGTAACCTHSVRYYMSLAA